MILSRYLTIFIADFLLKQFDLLVPILFLILGNGSKSNSNEIKSKSTI